MRFVVLGSVGVQQAGETVEISRTRRPLLATLLLAGGTGVTAQTLMQAVWGDTYGRENSLKTALSQLRRLIPGRIAKGGPRGYRMELQHDDTFDLAEFLALTEQGREQTAVGHHAEAVTSLERV